MSNYLVIGVGALNGHAIIVSAADREELFWAIDEHFNPYECVFHKVKDSISFYFPVKTTLEMETDLENECFAELNLTEPCLRQVPESGREIGMLLCDLTVELWKQVFLDSNNKLPEDVPLDPEWLCFADRQKSVIPYYLNIDLLEAIRSSAKVIAKESYRINSDS